MSKNNGRRTNTDVPGNAQASAAAFERYVFSLGRAWLDFERIAHDMGHAGTPIKRVTLKGPLVEGGSALIILTADSEEGPVVAFHNVDDLGTAIKGLAARLQNGSLKWKVDEYAK